MNQPASRQSASMRRKPSQNGSAASTAGDLMVFLIPALQFIHIKLIGALNGSDVALLLIFIVLLVRGKLQIRVPLARKLLALCSLWLLSQIVTDLVRHTAFADFARGWSNIIFTLVNFSAIFTLLYGKPRRIVFYGWGMVIGSLLTFFISPNDIAIEYPWKFGWSYPVTLALLLIASRKDVRGYWPVLLAVVAGMVNVFFGTRSYGAMCIAAGIYLLTIRFLRKRGLSSYRLTPGKVGIMVASAIIVTVSIYVSYEYAVSTGMLGEDALHKFQQQSSGRFGVLIGGRPELLASIPAIIDSPILGHGSWAKDPGYILAERQALAILGYEDAGAMAPEELENGLIPTHSYLFGAWVYAGILGAFFWAWVLMIVAKMLLRSYPRNILIPPAVPWFAISLLWSIPFSPYGSEVRITFPYYMVVLIGYLSIPEPQKASTAALLPNVRQMGAA